MVEPIVLCGTMVQQEKLRIAENAPNVRYMYLPA